MKISSQGVARLLSDLQPHKAPGPDGIPNTVLKSCANNIAPALSLINQRSLDTGTLPSDWLTANISAAFKKGDRYLAENYRPISLTSVPCKILEHVICRHLLNHLENNKILTNLNHGFRSGYSCETQLLTTVHDFVTSFENNKQVDVSILDFSKAFDTVPHRKLLHKLRQYGITDPIHSWLQNFLTGRTMRVVADGCCFDYKRRLRCSPGDSSRPSPFPLLNQRFTTQPSLRSAYLQVIACCIEKSTPFRTI